MTGARAAPAEAGGSLFRGWSLRARLLAVAQGLRERMRSLRPDWPSEEERRRDLAHHVALKRILDRGAGGFASLTGR